MMTPRLNIDFIFKVFFLMKFEGYLGEEFLQNSIIKPIHNDDTLKTELKRAKLLNMEDPTDPDNKCYNTKFENITFEQYSGHEVKGGKKRRKSKKRKLKKYNKKSKKFRNKRR